MSDTLGVIVDPARLEAERDEARAACAEIARSLVLILPDDVTEVLWERLTHKWPWLAEAWEQRRREGEP